MAFPFPKIPRHRYTAAERERILQDAGGICHLCTFPIEPGQDWQVSHIEIPHEHGGKIVGPAHYRCHKIETATVTAPLIHKVKRLRRRHNGSIQAAGNLPCGRNSQWKKTVAGDVEPRVAGFVRDRLLRSPSLDFSAPPIAARIVDTRQLLLLECRDAPGAATEPGRISTGPAGEHGASS